ncbi:hypothetical protein A3740_00745 [Oleiphilus sp. HI0068]|jgi:type II secretory pathway predicted ATPase ExeA|nr:hypothetical protein A3729_10945 [Oleiphilus sp. HI0043]KZY66037.1 hypothetical protein A3735_07440 [Oleiphilus sp. HI0061]KZY81428.1 hypothetical protein A3740_00745 [Oleiphilus sp. HI0068]KZY88367.1 hypothetical protein A3741_12765 [Oleiphilus sp. HI0069]KZY91364.1 hypothetical protein A3743_07165 [Oleiphilus sp. HI0072]KZZ72843.1 hypothetical protein A3763_09605 [Oleiphilus sp. HI0128]KZZ76055.1 hypothetical protein A3766_15130 [Oleiphilus sp. HI0132]
MSVTKNNNVLSEQLISHFNLKENPFDERMLVFFEGAQRQHNLETLRHMSTFGDMVLLLTGEKGAGKTTLLNKFAKSSAGELSIYVTDAQELANKEKSKSVIHDFGELVGLDSIVGETTRQSFSRLLQYLEDEFKKDGVRKVLVFDNADLLSKKELQFYFSYFSQLPKESGVVAIFSGLPSLLQLARLSHIEGDDEWLHQMQLKPLGASDMLEYLQLRLEYAGYTGLLELSESQVQHLIDMGKGLPGRVNRLFSSVVLEPGALKLPVKSRKGVPKQVFWGVAVLLCFSFLLVSYQYGLFTEGDSEAVAHEQPEQENNSDENKVSLVEQQREARLRMLDQALSESLAKASESNIDSLDKGRQGSGEIKKGSLNKPEMSASRSIPESAGVKELVEPDKVQDGTLADKEVSVPESDQLVSDTLQIEKIAKNVQEKIIPAAESSREILKPFFKGKAWVASQNSSGYSAQILGSYNEKTAIDFAKRVSKSAQPIYYLETLHRGKPWFVVFYGVYPDKASANAALKVAPKIITSQQPWLRSYAGILKSYPRQ